MSDLPIPVETHLDPLSTDGRMALGRVQPWGNPSYLAAEMGGGGLVSAWRPNMPPAIFPCPCCAGTATVTVHPSVIGVITLSCDQGCGTAELRRACQAKAPAATDWRDDLISEMPDAAIAAIETRLATGAMDASTIDALGREHGKAVLNVLEKMRRGSVSTSLYRVHNQHGGIVALIARADYPAGTAETKAIRQFHVERTFDGRLETNVGLFAGPWPLVGLADLADGPDRPVLVVEGEKARAAAAELLPEYTCLNSLCGASNAHITDWTPLVGREVVVLGDADEPGAAYALSVAAQAIKAGAKAVRIAAPPQGAPAGWDIGDPLPAGMLTADVRQLLTAAPVAQWDQVKHALRRDPVAGDWPPFRLPDGHLRGRQHLIEAIEAALERISSGCRQAPWLLVLGCLHHALGSDGLGLAVTWSKRGSEKHGKYKPGEVERLFDAFAVEPHPTPMSVRDLFWRAWRESRNSEAGGETNGGEGWRPEPEAMAEAELAVFETSHRKFRNGDNIQVGVQTQHADGSYRVEYLREETVKSEQKSNKVPGFNPKKKESISIFTLWEHHQRIKPLRLVFRPGEQVAPGEFNMFQGLGIRPRQAAGSYKLFRELIDRITTENKVPDDYLWKLLAYRLQNLNTFVPTCVVMIGTQGSFKSKVSAVMDKLLAPHSASIANPDNLVGSNNGTLQDKLLVQSEEIELVTTDQNNRLKNYITNPVIDYIDKFKQKWSGDNRTFIMMTSNARVPVRVPPDDRRFFLLRVSDPCNGDEEKRGDLHNRMEAELQGGGYEALMYDLLHTDLAGFNPRLMPKTPLFRELAGMDVEREPINNWWREHLEMGAVRLGNDELVGWGKRIGKDRLYEQYTGWSEKNGPAARNAIMAKDSWARRLKELVGGHNIALRVTNSAGKREQVFELPDHKTCCQAFEERFRCKLDRPTELPPSETGNM